MKSRTKFLITLSLFICSTSRASEIPSELLTILSEIRGPGLQCPERVWPRYSLKGTQVFFIYARDKKAFQWRADTDTLKEVEFEKLAAPIKSGLYWLGVSDDLDTVSIGVDTADHIPNFSAKTLARTLVFHELFHLHGQKKWPKDPVQSRSTLMPISSEARYFRNMIYGEIRQSLSVGVSHGHLANANHWYQKWVTEFPKEKLNFPDLDEATARYVEYQSIALSQVGCDASDAEVDAAYFSQNNEPSVASPQFSLALDREAYAIGGLVLKTLEIQDRTRQYVSEIENGKKPLEILFRNESQNPSAPGDDALRSAIEMKAKNENENFFRLVAPTLQAISDTQTIRVSLSWSALRGNLTPTGFYDYAKEGSLLTWVPLASAHEFKTMGENLTLTASADAVLILDLAEPLSICGDDKRLTFTVKEDELSEANGIAQIRSTLLNGSASGMMRPAPSGTRYFCVQ